MSTCKTCGAPARHGPPDGDFKYDPPYVAPNPQLTTLTQANERLVEALKRIDDPKKWKTSAPINSEAANDLGICIYAMMQIARTALSNTGEGVGVKVKALEWTWDGLCTVWLAASIIGEYQCYSIAGSAYFTPPAHVSGTFCGSDEQDAKAAAQADYERRILSALDLPSTTTGEE